MLADYHVHTAYCGHARGKIIQYVDRAIALGLREIGFADHLSRYYLTPAERDQYFDWGMSPQDLDRYFADLEGVRALYSGTIDIRVGLEIDFVEGTEDTLARAIEGRTLDFTLGSVHCLPRFGWHHLAHCEAESPLDIYREYFRCAKAAAVSKLFKSLAHLDFVWRYTSWPTTMSAELMSLIDDVVAAAARSDTAVEINANGFVWSALAHTGRDDPYDALVSAIVRHDTPITLGSDAHTPEAVGSAFPDIVPYLTKRGVTHLATFRHGQRVMVPLE
jgi:histidinol-phosphatase (PHP family)